MFKTKKIGLFLAAFAVLVLVLSACAAETVEVTRVVEQEVTRVITETEVVEGETVEVTRIVTEEVMVEVPAEPAEEEMMDKPITLNRNLGTEPPTYDPSLTTDTTSVELVGNSFVGLTVLDQVTAEVKPWLATDWSAGEDEEGNQTWTFNLRDDISWVQWDPESESVVEVLDDEGNVRKVMPSDVEFGVKRTIDPDTASSHAYVLHVVPN